MNLDKTAPVLVTGATGYIAGQLIKRLLEAGFNIHATVRDINNIEALKYLNALAEKSPGTIQYFSANLLDVGSYNKAMQGCQLVFHTASPFRLNVDNPQIELVDPAILGTQNVL